MITDNKVTSNMGIEMAIAKSLGKMCLFWMFVGSVCHLFFWSKMFFSHFKQIKNLYGTLRQSFKIPLMSGSEVHSVRIISCYIFLIIFVCVSEQFRWHPLDVQRSCSSSQEYHHPRHHSTTMELLSTSHCGIRHAPRPTVLGLRSPRSRLEPKSMAFCPCLFG